MIVYFSKSYNSSDWSYLAAGQWFGIARQYTTSSFSSTGSSNITLQGIRSIGLGASFDIYTGGGQNLEIIDIHEDRIWPDHMYVDSTRRDGGLQSFQGGKWRIWHTSWESGSDDMIDTHNTVANVAGVYRSSRTIGTQLTWGVFAACDTGFFPNLGDLVGFSHISDPATIYAKLTVQSVSEIKSGSCGNTVTFVESLPSHLSSGDFIQNLSEGPSSIHVKNVRAGNHEYNILNIKGANMVVEDSFFYNCTLAALEIVADICSYWCEAPRSDNILIRNNVFFSTNTAILIQGSAPRGDPNALLFTMLVDSAVYVRILNNTIYYNATNLIGQDTDNVPIVLAGVSTFDIANNVIWTNPGARNDIPLIQMCNMRDGVISGNKILESPFESGQGGYLCSKQSASSCPSYPVNKTLQWVTSGIQRGCSMKKCHNVTIYGDNTWQDDVTTIVPSEISTGCTRHRTPSLIIALSLFHLAYSSGFLSRCLFVVS
jgi:hypothetical protein